MKLHILIGISLGSLLLATAANGQSAEQQRRGEELKKKRSMADYLTNPVSGGPFLSGTSSNSGPNTPVGAPVVAFKGCSAPRGGNGASADTSDRMRTRQASQTDPVTARVFAAQAITEQDAAQNALESDCRYRFDGIWMQDVLPKFDKSKAGDATISAYGKGLALELTYTAFTSPIYMYVDMRDNGEALTIRPATSGHRPTLLRSRDGIPLSQVLKPNGPVKTYYTVAKPETPLQVNVTRFGKMRLRWAKQDFVRPAPTVTTKADVSAGDVFAVGYNLDNLGASLRGYDIVKQNPFKLNENTGTGQVFAKADPRDYRIVEKRTVPLGLKLIPHGDQGSSMQSRLITSQRQFQKTVSTSLGVNMGFTALNSAGEALSSLASASAGVDYAKSKTAGMSSGSRNSMASSIARHRVYSLLLDEPFASLSQEFIEAIDDANRFGRYDQLIAKFGTHYPHAVTYGSSGWKHNSYSESTIARWKAESENINSKAGFSLGGFSMESSTGRFVETQNSSSETEGIRTVERDAVGGTGGADDTTGTPYPILADLRPLYELLNPLNFPQEPMIYTAVRDKLKAATERYLRANSSGLSNASVEPELRHTWEITSHYIECVNIGNYWDEDITNRKSIELQGGITLRTQLPNGRAGPRITPFNLPVRQSGAIKKINCPNGRLAMPGTTKMRFTGTPAELARYRFRYHVDLHEWDEGVFNPSDVITRTPSHLIGFPVKANNKVGATYTRVWQMNQRTSGQPLLKIKSTFIRVR